jgi:hypothetical protein
MNEKGTALILSIVIIVALAAIGVVYISCSMDKSQQETQLTTSHQQSPAGSDTSTEEAVLYKSDWGTFTFGDKEVPGPHMANIYITYKQYFSRNGNDFSHVNSEDYHIIREKFMENVSMENIPENILLSPDNTRFYFRFTGPGDGYADYIANIRQPFNVTKLQLPGSYKPLITSYPIAWIDFDRILYRQFNGQSDKGTYWVIDVNNPASKKQVNLD